MQTEDRNGAISFQIEKTVIGRQDHRDQKVAFRIKGVNDGHAADAEYYLHCYDCFYAVPRNPFYLFLTQSLWVKQRSRSSQK